MNTNQQHDLPKNLVAFVCDPISEQIIKKVVTEMTIAFTHIAQGDIPDVLEYVKTNRTPQTLIVDISNSELPLSDISKIIEFSSPDISLIAIGSRNEVGLFRDLLKLGIIDYVVKPLNDELMHKILKIAISGTNKTDLEESRSGKLISVIGSVGGVGATTIATNMAWIIANKRFKRSAIVDLDFYHGNANLLLDIKTEGTYLDVLESPDKIDEYFVETSIKKHGNRLHYLGGLTDLARDLSADIKAFAVIVEMVRKRFNYILIDTPRTPTQYTRACLKQSNYFFIICEYSIASAQNAIRLIEYLEQETNNPHILIVSNKIGISSNGSLSRDAFENAIGRTVDYAIPFDGKMAMAAANVGQPIASMPSPMNPILETMADEITMVNQESKWKKIIDSNKEDCLLLVKNFLAKHNIKFFEKLKK